MCNVHLFYTERQKRYSKRRNIQKRQGNMLSREREKEVKKKRDSVTVSCMCMRGKVFFFLITDILKMNVFRKICQYFPFSLQRTIDKKTIINKKKF